MNLTPDQERAVSVTGIDMCIRAGAGSGKTRVLIERAVRLLTREDDPLRLSEILAITFTEKAALEMKVRLADELEKHRGPSARAKVQWAFVLTIHAFCARLLRENAVEAGVDPSFRVLDEERARALLTESQDEVAGAYAAERREDLDLLARIYLKDPIADLSGLYATIRGAGLGPADVTIPEPDIEEVRLHLGRAMAGLASLPELMGKTNERGRSIAAAALEFLPGFEAALTGWPDYEAFESLVAEFTRAVPLNIAKALKEVLKPVREEHLPRARAALAALYTSPGLIVLREFLDALDRTYRHRKGEAGVLDFTDLEARAFALLAEHPEVRDGIAGRFRQILVDEYQDVNPLQEKIIRLLRSPGNHFAVGDVKQSIYGFRHAEPRLFKACAEESGEEGAVDLAVNFRSSPGLVEFTNHCFGTLFRTQSLVDWRAMESGAEYEPAAAPEVEILLSPGEGAADYRKHEARALAARIREMVRDETFTVRRGGDRQGERISYRDIAILFRTLRDLKLYERALEDQGVPCYVVKGGGYYQAREIVDLLDLLRIIRNPLDEIALAAVLRSPFAGLSDDALAVLALARKRDGRMGDLLARDDAPPDLPVGDAENWARFVTLFRRLRDLAGRVPLRELLATALRESGYADAVWGFHGGRRHVANFRKALALAESFEGVADLAGFVRALEEMKNREVRETEAPTGGEAEDVVRILTVHGAKGLEFPVVFLPDLNRKGPTGSPPLSFERGMIAVKALSPSGETQLTPAFRQAEEERKQREAEENLRVFYVAVTRAEEHLVLLAHDLEGKPGGPSFWDALQTVLDTGGEEAPFGESGRVARVVRADARLEPGPRRVTLFSRHASNLAAGVPLGIEGDAEAAWAAEMIGRVTRERPEEDGTCYQNTISELLLHSHCRRCYRDRIILGIPRTFEAPAGEDRPERAGDDELPATDWGIAVHEVLRVYRPGKDDLAAVALRRTAALRPGGYPADFVETVVRMVRSFYESPVGIDVLAADPATVRRETPFLVRWGIADPHTPDLILRGQIDLLYPRPDGVLAVVDYKTGSSAAERYAIQLQAYARALTLFSEGRIGEAGIVFLADGKKARYESVALDEAADRDLDEKAARFARDLRDGLPPGLPHARGCRR